MGQSEIGALRVVLSMNAGEFSRGRKGAEGDLEKLTRSLKNFSKSAAKAGAVLSATLTAPLALFGKASLDAAKQFETGMANVSTLIDTASESMKEMNDQVLKIGRETPVALSDLTGSLYDIRSAGIAAEDAMTVLDGSARLAVAGLGSTKQATDLVTSSINAFGLEGKDAADVYDTIFKTVKAGKTTIGQLAQGFGAVAGTVASADIKLDEYLASVAALTTTGLPAAQAHTQIRAAISGLTRETELSKKVFDALGARTFKDLIQKSGGMVNAFERIFDALQGDSAQLIKLLGSVEAYNALIGLSVKQNDTFRSTLEGMRGGVNQLDEAFAKQNSTIAATQQRMNNAIESIGISIGNILAPAAAKVAQVLGDIADAFASLSPEIQTMIVVVAGLAAAIGPLILVAGALAAAMGALLPVLATVGVVIAGLVAAAGPIGLFVIAASAAVTAWNIFKEQIIAIFDSVTTFVTEKIDAIVASVKAMALSVGTALSQLTDLDFSGALETMNAAFTASEDVIVPVIKRFTTELETVNKTAETIGKEFEGKFTIPIINGLAPVKTATAEYNALMAEGKRIMESVRTPMEEIIATQARLNELLRAGAIDSETFGRAMARTSEFSSKSMRSMGRDIGSVLDSLFKDSKAASIAQAVISTYTGMSRALELPFPANLAAAAAVAAQGFANVAAIKSTNKSSGSGGSSAGSAASAGSGSSGAAAEQAPRRLIVQGLDPNSLLTGVSVKNLAEMLLAYQADNGQVVLR